MSTTTDIKFLSNQEVIKFLATTNDYRYNLLKALEECSELVTALAQKLTKEEIVLDQTITDEIGDVQIRIQVLKELFGEKIINDRIQYKLDNYKTFIHEQRYIGSI